MWVSVKDAALARGVTVQAIYKAIKSGKLKARLAKVSGRAIEVRIETQKEANHG
jgi:predicted DNA-binding protein (UPF0251 family)